VHLKRYFPHKKQNSSIYASYNTLLGLYTLNTRHLLMFKAETLGRMVQQTKKLCLSCTTWHCDNLNKFSFLEFFLAFFLGQSYLILSGNNCSKVISTGHASPAWLLHACLILQNQLINNFVEAGKRLNLLYTEFHSRGQNRCFTSILSMLWTAQYNSSTDVMHGWCVILF